MIERTVVYLHIDIPINGTIRNKIVIFFITGTMQFSNITQPTIVERETTSIAAEPIAMHVRAILIKAQKHTGPCVSDITVNFIVWRIFDDDPGITPTARIIGRESVFFKGQSWRAFYFHCKWVANLRRACVDNV